MSNNVIRPTLEGFAEVLRQSRELEEKILAAPDLRETYLHVRWHTQHPDEECPICEK